jgi:hypothetical protein
MDLWAQAAIAGAFLLTACSYSLKVLFQAMTSSYSGIIESLRKRIGDLEAELAADRADCASRLSMLAKEIAAMKGRLA